MTVKEICSKAKENASVISLASVKTMNKMLQAAADALRTNLYYLIDENGRDVEACTRGPQFVDRLRLNRLRIEGIAMGLEKLIDLPTPVGEIMESYLAPNGMEISRVRVPIGVVGIIYEARPNVTADAIGLCIKSGNAIVLRGSKEAIFSNRAIVRVIKEAIAGLGVSPEFIQLIEDTDRSSALEFMKMNGLVDVIIPRGSASLIQSAVRNATVPIIETGVGNCHIYVESSANILMATNILVNAKTQRMSVCNACESLVVDEVISRSFLPFALGILREKGIEIRGDEKTRELVPDVIPATEEDYSAEFLGPVISVKVVRDVTEAIAFINAHSTHHSDAIVTKNTAFAEKFLNEVDSAVVYVNASTRFTDGFEFGFGAEMGISTQKLHARGPMGLRELTSYKYKIRGNGQVRT